MSARDPAAIRDAERRLAILRILGESPRRTAVERTLQHTLETWGHARGVRGLHADLDWLRDRGCVTVEEIGAAPVVVLHLSRSGMRVYLRPCTCREHPPMSQPTPPTPAASRTHTATATASCPASTGRRSPARGHVPYPGREHRAPDRLVCRAAAGLYPRPVPLGPATRLVATEQ